MNKIYKIIIIYILITEGQKVSYGNALCNRGLRLPSSETERKLVEPARGTMFSVAESCCSHPIGVPHDRPSPLLAVPPLFLTLAAPRANIIHVPRGASRTISPTRTLARVPRTHEGEGALDRKIQVCPREWMVTV